MDFRVFTQKLFEQAAAAKISPAEVYAVETESLRINTRDQALDKYAASTSIGLSLRGTYQGNMGYASTQVMDEAAISMLLQGVMESASLVEDKEKTEIFAGSPTYPNVQLFSQPLHDMPAKDKIALAMAMEKAAVSQHPAVKDINENMLSYSKSTLRITNTYGLDISYDDNGLFGYCLVIAREDGKTENGMEFFCTRDASTVDPQAIAQTAVQNAIDLLSAEIMESGTKPVVLSNLVVCDMLGVFCDVFSAENTQKGLSLLKGRVGEDMASPLVTLVDDPLLPEGLNSRPFDAEGVASAKHTIVEKGKLITLLHNLKTARIDGVLSTGNADKAGYSAPVHVAPSNFVFSAGNSSLEALFAQAGDGLYVTDISGLHAGANLVSGDFSLIASGFRIAEGKLAGSIHQVTVAGNFFQLLKDITAVGNDQRMSYNTMIAPSVLVKEHSIAGK